MYLYILNRSNNCHEFVFNTENTKIEYNGYDKLCCYRYIMKQYIPLDESDILI